MKKSLLIVAFFTLNAQAQDVGVKVNHVDATQDTTISIKKGDVAAKKKYVITEGEDEITGDKAVVMKQAEKSWKVACSEWKTEFKDINKENKIMSLTCGRMRCTKDGVESTCTSTAKHKVRTLTEE